MQDILDQLEESPDGDKTSVDDIVSAFRHRGFGPLLMVPSLFALIPIIGGIPGASLLLAALIILIAGQMVVGRESPWIPGRLRRMSFDSDKLKKGIKKARPYAKSIDHHTTSRVQFLTSDIAKRIIAVVCILLAIAMIPLAAVPFGVAIPATALLLLAIGLSARDGLILAIGLAASLLSGYAIWQWV